MNREWIYDRWYEYMLKYYANGEQKKSFGKRFGAGGRATLSVLFSQGPVRNILQRRLRKRNKLTEREGQDSAMRQTKVSQENKAVLDSKHLSDYTGSQFNQSAIMNPSFDCADKGIRDLLFKNKTRQKSNGSVNSQIHGKKILQAMGRSKQSQKPSSSNERRAVKHSVSNSKNQKWEMSHSKLDDNADSVRGLFGFLETETENYRLDVHPDQSLFKMLMELQTREINKTEESGKHVTEVASIAMSKFTTTETQTPKGFKEAGAVESTKKEGVSGLSNLKIKKEILPFPEPYTFKNFKQLINESPHIKLGESEFGVVGVKKFPKIEQLPLGVGESQKEQLLLFKGAKPKGLGTKVLGKNSASTKAFEFPKGSKVGGQRSSQKTLNSLGSITKQDSAASDGKSTGGRLLDKLKKQLLVGSRADGRLSGGNDSGKLPGLKIKAALSKVGSQQKITQNRKLDQILLKKDDSAADESKLNSQKLSDAILKTDSGKKPETDVLTTAHKQLLVNKCEMRASMLQTQAKRQTYLKSTITRPQANLAHGTLDSHHGIMTDKVKINSESKLINARQTLNNAYQKQQKMSSKERKLTTITHHDFLKKNSGHANYSIKGKVLGKHERSTGELPIAANPD